MQSSDSPNPCAFFCLLAIWLCIPLPTLGQGQWQQQNSGTTKRLLSISMGSAQVGYSCGVDSTLLKTTDGGTTWFPLAIAAFDFTEWVHDFVDVRFEDEDTGYLVLNTINNPYASGTVYKTTDGGLSWQAQFPFCTIAVARTMRFGAGPAYLLGSAYFAGATLVQTVQDSCVSGINFSWDPGQYLYAAMFDDNGFGLAAGDGGHVYRTRNGGISWDTVYTGSDYTIFDIDRLEDGSIIAATGNPDHTMLHSTDSGSTWQAYTATTQFSQTIMRVIGRADASSLVVAGHAVSGTDTLGRVLWQSSGSWEYEDVPHPIYDVVTWGDTLAYAVGDSGLIITKGPGPVSTFSPAFEKSVTVFPNPCTHWFRLESKGPKSRGLQLRTAEGRLIRSLDPAAAVHDVSELPSGFYLLEIATDNTSYFKKIVVHHP
jgi:photosystem II stability/assembly factor-like uncharacterized protein